MAGIRYRYLHDGFALHSGEFQLRPIRDWIYSVHPRRRSALSAVRSEFGRASYSRPMVQWPVFLAAATCGNHRLKQCGGERSARSRRWTTNQARRLHDNEVHSFWRKRQVATSRRSIQRFQPYQLQKSERQPRHRQPNAVRRRHYGLLRVRNGNHLPRPAHSSVGREAVVLKRYLTFLTRMLAAKVAGISL